MGFFANLDMALQKDLMDFVEEQEAKEGKHTLGDVLIAEILRKIIDGDCRMSGCATNHEKKRMYVEFTFYEDE